LFFQSEIRDLGEFSGASGILNPFGDKIGSVSQEVLETISQFGLDSYLNNLGYVSHGELLINAGPKFCY
jgi:hypothetical protein